MNNIDPHPRLLREKSTIHAMIALYCRAHHSSQEALCQDCNELFNYAAKRLISCPHQHDKPTCSNCMVHCYKPGMRQRIREVMRFSGPRMTYRHPLMAVQHLWDSRKKGT